MKMLLTHKDINVNIQDKIGQTPLHTSIERCRLDILQQLLSHEDIEVNIEDNEGKTPLQHAIENNDSDSVEQLLSHKNIDVNTTDKYGCSILRVAVENCRPKCVEALLTHKDINIHIKDEQNRTSLEIAELLLDLTSDENYSTYKQKYERIVALLQKFELSEHQLQNNYANLNRLTERKSTPEDEPQDIMPLIHKVVKNENYNALRHILDNNLIKVNSRDTDRDTPLHKAIRNDGAECLRILLSQKDINVNARDSWKRTLLH